MADNDENAFRPFPWDQLRAHIAVCFAAITTRLRVVDRALHQRLNTGRWPAYCLAVDGFAGKSAPPDWLRFAGWGLTRSAVGELVYVAVGVDPANSWRAASDGMKSLVCLEAGLGARPPSLKGRLG